MGRFLRETRELFYWAMFCPSRLQQRMNEWSPAEEKDGQIPNTNPWDILLFRFHLRFVIQYLILLLCFSLPLILIIVAQGQALNWLQLPIILVTAYSVGVWFLPIGLQVPLIWFIVYLEQPKSWIKGFNLVLESLTLFISRPLLSPSSQGSFSRSLPPWPPPLGASEPAAPSLPQDLG